MLQISPLTDRLRQAATTSRALLIAYHVGQNWWAKQRFARGNSESSDGATHRSKTLHESINYRGRVFQDYLTYSGLTVERLKGTRVLEVGPGDNLGVALKFLAAGARQVVCLDKFFSKRDSIQQLDIYRELRRQLTESERRRFDSALSLQDDIIEMNSDLLLYEYGMGMEDADKRFEAGSFDIIVSRAVVETFCEPDAAFRSMDNLLRAGGWMIHKIDLRDHGMFSSHGFHPLTFLTIRESIYRLMTRDSGKPNGLMVNYYQEKMRKLRYSFKMFITHVVGGQGDLIPHKEALAAGEDYSEATLSCIRAIQPQLRDRYRDLSEEELLVSGIFLIGRKPESLFDVDQEAQSGLENRSRPS